MKTSKTSKNSNFFGGGPATAFEGRGAAAAAGRATAATDLDPDAEPRGLDPRHRDAGEGPLVGRVGEQADARRARARTGGRAAHHEVGDLDPPGVDHGDRRVVRGVDQRAALAVGADTDRAGRVAGVSFADAKAGDAILFDYRVLHRGLANTSAKPRPLLYFTYGRAWFTDATNYSALSIYDAEATA